MGNCRLFQSHSRRSRQEQKQNHSQNHAALLEDSGRVRAVHLHGRRYNWSNERQSPTLVRLDRALASLQWEERFPSCHLHALATDASDHCPILLQTNLSITTKPHFHLEIFWPKFADYQDALQRGWRCPDNVGDPIRRLDIMFKNLANELKSWAARKIGVIKEQLLMA